MWRPETEDQIRIAIADGNIYESAFLDVKREIEIVRVPGRRRRRTSPASRSRVGDPHRRR